MTTTVPGAAGPTAGPAVRLRRFDRTEYDRLVAEGWFDGEPLELIEGMLVEMSPQGTPHMWSITRLATALIRMLDPDRHEVRVQGPLALTAESEPEPDLAVVDIVGPEAHPSTAHLVVEVAQSSLPFDLDTKARLYARAGIADYWVVDLAAAEVVVHRDPRDGVYRSITRHDRGETLHALGLDLASDTFVPPRPAEDAIPTDR